MSNAARRIADDRIERARAVPVEVEAQRHGLKLKRQGHELVGPCPRCGGHDRFSISVRKQVFNCRGCGVGGDVIALVQHLDGGDFTAAIATLTGDEVNRAVPGKKKPVSSTGNSAPADERDRIHQAADLWRARQPIVEGSPPWRYLREARGITCPLPATLGFLPAWRDLPPRMIAAFGHCEEPEPGIVEPPRTVEAVHLTYLRPNGTGKADMPNPKQFRGAVRGQPIVIAPMNDLLGLAITEGIEDALSVHEATGLGAWAAGSAPHLGKLADAVPDYTDCVSIYADANKAGQEYAATLAERLTARGISAEIVPSAGAAP
jgi:putative DNA primase/helicase